ncbi:low temperature requirement protein A [Lysinimonas soli]|uniref:Low temperature requirement protein A n=1 Tax=Lysinimonas soli TaxID=1074233 RepID=A0ABW0NQ01_9MICO
MPASFHVRMQGRSIDESHRASTPFELLFDLVFVVAVASVVTQLAHAIIAGRLGEGIGPFLMVFFAIWWAWMNFTWFSSGYDTDDVLYRLLGFVQMAGVVVIAASVPAAFEGADYRPIAVGYLIMRLGLVALWVRAAIEHPQTRAVSSRYAIGIVVAQGLWLLRLLLPVEWLTVSFVVFALVELSVPVWANRAGRDPWHPGHIAERYGLFVIILLGEGVLAATSGVQSALAASGVSPALIAVGIAGLAMLFGLWWVYFLQPSAEGLRRRRGLSFYWGYGHYLLFAAIAAVGAGLEVAVQAAGHPGKVPDAVAGWAVAVPLAVVLVLIWVLHRPLVERSEVPAVVVLPAAALMLCAPLAAPLLGLVGVAVLLIVLLAVVIAVTMLMGPDTRRGADEASRLA